ncbi:hypothetical protein QBC39DRAFT_419978, partial [Podospora conica]
PRWKRKIAEWPVPSPKRAHQQQAEKPKRAAAARVPGGGAAFLSVQPASASCSALLHLHGPTRLQLLASQPVSIACRGARGERFSSFFSRFLFAGGECDGCLLPPAVVAAAGWAARGWLAGCPPPRGMDRTQPVPLPTGYSEGGEGGGPKQIDQPPPRRRRWVCSLCRARSALVPFCRLPITKDRPTKARKNMTVVCNTYCLAA